MEIAGLQKLTLLDFPEHTACTAFLAGCNLRCPFCHNAPLVLGNPSRGEGSLSGEAFLAFLEKRRDLLEGVCVTGGEPTLHPELPELLRKVRSLGYRTKLDTNGTRPEVLRALLAEGLCDYVAMDIKTSPERYAVVTGVPDFDVSPVRESTALLMEGRVPFEFRTTVVSELHRAEDFEAVGQWLEGSERYFLQCFRDSGDCIRAGFTAPSEETLREYLAVLRRWIPNTELRGV